MTLGEVIRVGPHLPDYVLRGKDIESDTRQREPMRPRMQVRMEHLPAKRGRRVPDPRGEESPEQTVTRPQKEPAPPTPCSWTSGLRSCGKRNFSV